MGERQKIGFAYVESVEVHGLGSWLKVKKVSGSVLVFGVGWLGGFVYGIGY
jgi:hypothetical protein